MLVELAVQTRSPIDLRVHMISMGMHTVAVCKAYHTVQRTKAPTMEAFPIIFQIKFGYPKFEFAQSANSIPL